MLWRKKGDDTYKSVEKTTTGLGLGTWKGWLQVRGTERGKKERGGERSRLKDRLLPDIERRKWAGYGVRGREKCCGRS